MKSSIMLDLLTTCLLFLSFRSTWALPAAEQAALPSVTISQGTYVGTTTTVAKASITSVQKYLGIRYAPAPTRFSLPGTLSTNTAVVSATAYKPQCPGAVPTSQPFFADNSVSTSEDCLYVNIFKPVSSSTAPKAVMVWFYGGGLLFGSSSYFLYDGTTLAANNDVIVVTFNYRTNIFGFPNAPESIISRSTQNIGFFDQRLALKWISNNIRAFGGDPTKITIFGQSSGASSVDRLINVPPLDSNNVPLFRAAILESGQASLGYGFGPPFAPTTGDPQTNNWQSVAKSVGCSSSINQLQCMQNTVNVPFASLTSAVQAIATDLGTPFPAVNDDNTQLRTPLINNNLVYTSGPANSGPPRRAHIPLLIGSNILEAGLVQIIQQEQGQTIWSDTDAYHVTEALYQCVAERVAKAQVNLNNDLTSKPVWRYVYDGRFDDVVRIVAPNGIRPPLSLDNVGSYHTSEIPVVFGTYSGANSTLIALSNYVQKAWGNFAKNPSAAPASGFYQQTATSSNPVPTQTINCLGCSGNPTGLSPVDEKTLDGNCPINFNNGYNSPAPNA